MATSAQHTMQISTTKRYVIRRSKIACLFILACFCSSSFADANSLILGTQSSLQTIEAYYQAIDQQLNKRSANRSRDPFANTLTNAKAANAAIKDSLFTPTATNSAPSNKSAPAQFQGEIPALSFKGILQSGEKKIALLKIQGQGTFIVKVGDKVGIRQVGSSSAVLHILEINELNIIVETGSYKEKMVVQ